MSDPSVPPPRPGESSGHRVLYYGGLVLLILVLVVAATAGVTAWRVRRALHAPPITPTELSRQEEQVLDGKLAALDAAEEETPPANKTIAFTEKELNALLARNTDLGDKVYVKIGRDSISARCNLPVPDDAPFLGGRTLRGRVRLQVALQDHQLGLFIKEVTVGGISLPNAWLGGLKNVDLMQEYFADNGPMDAFLAGIDRLDIEPGRVRVILSE